LIKIVKEETRELHEEIINEGTTIPLFLKVKSGETDPDRGIEITQET
jgi:hypothetical protein